MTHKEAKVMFEHVQVQYNKGLITEAEYNNQIFQILYQVLFPEQFK